MERFRHHARGMTPYQIFVKFMQQTLEEIYQHLLERRIKYNCSKVDFGHSSRLYYEEPVSNRALQGHSGNNLYISTVSHEKIEKEIRIVSVPSWRLKI